jgi:hypothetical protein
VTALPPADGQATAEVGNEQPNECIHSEDLCDGPMSSIVGREHNLMLLMQLVQALGLTKLHSQRTQNKPRKTAEVMYHS